MKTMIHYLLVVPGLYLTWFLVQIGKLFGQL